MCKDDLYKHREEKKWPWLDKGLDIGLSPPINPENHTVTCRSIAEWEVLPDTTGGKLDSASESQDLEHVKKQALLQEDVVGIVSSRSRVWHGEFGIAKVYFYGDTYDSQRPFWELFNDDTDIGFWQSSRLQKTNAEKGIKVDFNESVYVKTVQLEKQGTEFDNICISIDNGEYTCSDHNDDNAHVV